MRNAGIVLQNIGLTPAFGQKADNEVRREPRSLDYGFTGKNIWADRMRAWSVIIFFLVAFMLTGFSGNLQMAPNVAIALK